MAYDRVLLTTDLSANAEAACRYGAWLAGDAEVRLLRVVHLPERHALMSPTLRKELERSASHQATRARRELDAWAKNIGLDIGGIELRDGIAKKDIVTAADEWDADLVVVGHHGRGLVGRHVLGSTARAVLRHASCDVLVVPDLTPPRHEMARVCVATDFYGPSEAAAKTARELATAKGAELLAAHVIDADLWVSVGYEDSAVGADGHVDRQVVMENVREMLRDFNKKILGGEAREVLAQGRPAEQLADLAQAEGVDLLVTGTHGAGRLERWMLGSVAESIVEAAACPVLVVKA